MKNVMTEIRFLETDAKIALGVKDMNVLGRIPKFVQSNVEIR